MKIHLLPNFVDDPVAPEEGAEAGERGHDPAHGDQLDMTRCTAPVSRVQLSVSAVSCARPALVRR